MKLMGEKSSGWWTKKFLVAVPWLQTKSAPSKQPTRQDHTLKALLRGIDKEPKMKRTKIIEKK